LRLSSKKNLVLPSLYFRKESQRELSVPKRKFSRQLGDSDKNCLNIDIATKSTWHSSAEKFGGNCPAVPFPAPQLASLLHDAYTAGPVNGRSGVGFDACQCVSVDGPVMCPIMGLRGYEYSPTFTGLGKSCEINVSLTSQTVDDDTCLLIV
jgi:hypothetical protein